MGRVFAVRPKRIKRTNGQVLTPRNGDNSDN